MNGILISLEGPDGAGKTTVLKEILPEIQKMKREIVATREPGGVRVAEEIRQIITALAKNSLSKLGFFLHSSRNLTHCCWCLRDGVSSLKKSDTMFRKCSRHEVRMRCLKRINSSSSNCSP